MIRKRALVLSILLFLGLPACQNDQKQTSHPDYPTEHDSEHYDDDFESLFGDSDFKVMACRKATAEELRAINAGNALYRDFINFCRQETANSSWCDELVRPNPTSRSVFNCTYGPSQPHRLIHPNKATWPFAVEAVKLVKELESKGIRITRIYNWWRPEPYNANVGGSATRHPFGTSVDVRFANKANQNKAFTALCKLRTAGRLRAIGYYPGTGLHFGVGDNKANTWGRKCP